MQAARKKAIEKKQKEAEKAKKKADKDSVTGTLL